MNVPRATQVCLLMSKGTVLLIAKRKKAKNKVPT